MWHRQRTRSLLAFLVALAGIGVTSALLAGVGSAARAAPPSNVSPPTISGTPQQGQTLTASPGAWNGRQPISFDFQWRRCNHVGGSCSNISGATGSSYTLSSVDVGNTLRVRVRATNRDGSSAATSVPTAVIRRAPSPPSNGCPNGPGPVQVSQVTPPARLTIDQWQIAPSPVTSQTQSVVVRVHVSDTCNQTVQGALVYVTFTPYNQFSVPPEATTDSTGWAQLTMNRLAGFPATRDQQLLATFIRARKPGENVLTGISNRRLVSFPVNLSG